MRSPESIAFHLSNSILSRFFCTVLERVDDVINIVSGAKRQFVYHSIDSLEALSSAVIHVIYLAS